MRLAFIAGTVVVAVGGVVAPAAAAEGCPPVSKLSCSSLTPAVPFSLDFGTDAGGYVDGSGVGTGFTMVQPSASGTYRPEMLSVDRSAGLLRIAATSGTSYLTPTTTTNGNSLDNGLGIKVDSSKSLTVATRVVDLPDTLNAGEAAGLWLGADQDNYVKFTAVATAGNLMKVQLAREVNGLSSAADEQNGPTAAPGDDVQFAVAVDPAGSRVTGTYSINGGAVRTVGSLSLPPSFFTASGANASGNYAGLFSSSRRNWQVGPAGLPFYFDYFRADAGAVALQPVPPTTVPAPAPTGSGVLSVTNTDPAPGDSRVLLSRIQNPADSYQRFHDKATLRLKNTGSTTLTVSSIAVTEGAFTATSPWMLPFKLTTGSTVDIVVQFTATTGTWQSGNLAIKSSSTTGSTTNIGLAGFWQKYSEHNLEPRLPDIVSNFGYGTVMPAAIYSRGAYQKFSSDEMLSPYWTLLDPAKTARVTQLAAWRGYASDSKFRTYTKGAPGAPATVLTGLKFDAQSILPRNSAWAAGTATFQPSGTFGFILDNEYSDPTLNDSAPDRAAGCTAAQCGQHVRVWQLRDGAGAAVPGSFIFAEDYAGINYDYQDNVYLVENIKPG